MQEGKRLSKEFFMRDVLDVAPELPGKISGIKNDRWISQPLHDYRS